jgi:hypothetical protein
MRPRRALTVALLSLSTLLAPPPAATQSLEGSQASIERMYRQARAHELTFLRTPAAVRTAREGGRLVSLSGNADYRLHAVAHPYVLPSTRVFVERLAAQYRAACGERLVVTSATRPSSHRLANGTDRSVHPTGMAIDLRRPTAPRCLAWLRRTLLHLEGAGVVEATEERRPPHFHVAVYPRPYRRYVEGRGGRVPQGGGRSASSAAPSAGGATTYRVRQGDTLWSIARRHSMTVEELRRANEVAGSRIVVGQLLVIPGAAR